MRHIYFLNCNYNPKSKVILKLECPGYIDWVSDAITIHDQNGIRESYCVEEGIKLYSSYSNGVLSSEITPTRGIVQNTLAKNSKVIYAEVPIKTGLIALKFKEIGLR